MAGVDYFTHPDHMRGAERQKQNVMMHKQLAHFEKCVKDVKGTYFSPTHNNMLRDLVPSNVIVTSLSVLRELVKREASRQHKKGIDIEDSELVKHFDDFFQTIADLRRLKRDFTDKIYSVLFEFFYPISLNDVPDMLGKGGKRMSKVKNDNLSNIKSNSDPTDDEDDVVFEMPDDLLSECNEMRDTIENIHHVNYRWEKLMTSDEIDANFFDTDTLRELRLYDSSKNFEYMLRLVPDIINKSLRAVDLARKWWFNSDKLCKKLERFKKEMTKKPRRRRSPVLISELENSELSDEEIDHEPKRIEGQDVGIIDNDTLPAVAERHRNKISGAPQRYHAEKQNQAAARYLDEKQKEATKCRKERQKEVEMVAYRNHRQDELPTMHRNEMVTDNPDEIHEEAAVMRYQDETHDATIDARYHNKKYKNGQNLKNREEKNKDIINEKYPDKRNKQTAVDFRDKRHKEKKDESDVDFKQNWVKVTGDGEYGQRYMSSNTESDEENDDRSESNENGNEDVNFNSNSYQYSKPPVVSKSEKDHIIDESYKSIVTLLEELKQVIARIGMLEKELLTQKKELSGLLKRQNRLDDLSSDVEKAKDTKDNVHVKLKELKETKVELQNKISRSKPGSLLHNELKKTLASIEEDIMELKNAVKLHEFHHELLTSDLDVEMEMRPTLTGYSKRLQSKVLELENNLASETERKNLLEKRLIIAKANLQKNMKENSMTEQDPSPPSEQMYVFQSGLKNPPFVKPPRIPKTESNHSGTDQRDYQSPVDTRKRSKVKPPVSVASSVTPTLPELVNGHASQAKRDTKRRSRKPDVSFIPTTDIDNSSTQFSDATSNADMSFGQNKPWKRKSKKKNAAGHNVLFTPQNGGRYRKSPGSQVNKYGTDRCTSTSDDGEFDFRQGLPGYSMEDSSREEHQNISNRNLNATYCVEEQSGRANLHPKDAKTKVASRQRKPRRNNKKQIQQNDESDGEAYLKPQTMQPKKQNRLTEYPTQHKSKKQHDARTYIQTKQQTPYIDEDDALSIPDDPDAGSSESNDSDFSEELKAKQQKLRQLRHLNEAKQKHVSYERPQPKPEKHPKLYDPKRNSNGYAHFEETPPPPPGYREKRSRIPVKLY